MPDPIIVFSSAENERHTGDSLYNGGVKLQNLWCKLLRQHGWESYVCTYDGRFQPWLLEHQPHVPIRQVERWGELGREVLMVTTWIVASLALEAGTSVAFFDAETAHTQSGTHYAALKRWMPKLKIATHSRTQQGWYMFNFGITPPLIREWSDTAYWFPCPERRVPRLVGYSHEGPHTFEHLDIIRQRCEAAHEPVQFLMVHGSEREVIDAMQQCDIFLGLNPGKHPLFLEGCPRMGQESLHAGCVLIAYSVHGNEEYLYDGYSGFLVPHMNPNAMAERLIQVLGDDEMRERVRAQGHAFVAANFAPTEARYQQVKEWLEL